MADRYMDNLNRALLVAHLLEARAAIDQALEQTKGDEMYKENKNRCLASIDQARAKLAYAWNALAPFTGG